ncbi:peptidase M75 [Thalassobaculum fulvum]|uniref:Peptidase M75 n=1 Tax=Thalassobaculum fulvum TaxID=1633335 RepID=A0A918XQD5_9PROT|nr:imelysin family protein [Thalassobaculum fulvum]GHD44281.1 peptidase M75 [Thalassobaculum fulvum]
MRVLPTVLALALLAAPFSATPAAADPARDAAIVARAVTDYIRPATERFARDTHGLDDAVEGFCAAPGGDTRAALDAAFRGAVEGWSGIQFLRFGPLVEEHRLERIAFWPDPKGIGLRQLRRALADRDATVTDPGQLAGKSVALQGLTALEYLLYGDGGDQLDAFRCAFATAAAGSLAAVADAIAGEWAAPDGFAQRLIRPGSDDPVYRTPAESLAELHRALTTGLQVTRDQKLKPVLGDTPDTAKPFLAPFRRAGLSVAVLAADLSALGAFTAAAGFARDLPDEYRWLDNSLAFEFGNAVRAVGSVELPIDEAVYDQTARGRLEYLFVVLGNLQTMTRQDLATALDLKGGFNALDGD